jgi:hypothetical protein
MAFSRIIQVRRWHPRAWAKLTVYRSGVLGYGIMCALCRDTGHVRSTRSGDEERHFLEVLKHHIREITTRQ